MILDDFNIATDNEKIVHYNYGRYVILDLVTLDYVVLDKSTYAELLENYRNYIENKSLLFEEKIVDNKQSVNIVMVTGFDCNYDCTYCYQKDYKDIKDKLNKKDFENIRGFYRIYDEYFNTGTVIEGIDVMGGEPFLDSNVELIEGIFEEFSNSKISFTTNGANIMNFKHIIESNKDNITKIILSIDGEKEMHNKYRRTSKEEYYDNIWEGLDFLIKCNMDVHISAVYHPEDNEEYGLFFDKLEAYGWLENKFTVGFAMDITKKDKTEEDYIGIIRNAFINMLNSDKRAKLVGQNFIDYNRTTIYNMIKQRKKIEPYIACEVCKKPSYTFLPNGDIIVCLGSSNSKFKVGTYKPEITMNTDIIESINSRDFRNMDRCIDCEYRYFCKGGCVANALNDSGTLESSYCGRWKEGNYKEALEDVLDQLIRENSN